MGKGAFSRKGGGFGRYHSDFTVPTKPKTELNSEQEPTDPDELLEKITIRIGILEKFHDVESSWLTTEHIQKIRQRFDKLPTTMNQNQIKKTLSLLKQFIEIIEEKVKPQLKSMKNQKIEILIKDIDQWCLAIIEETILPQFKTEKGDLTNSLLTDTEVVETLSKLIVQVCQN